MLLGVVCTSALYVWWRLGTDWIPFDDGTLAQSAERVMQGQLPHRDFDELYTGGLSALNAAAFRLIGTNLWSLRLVLFAVFLAWVPALFYIASRFARPLVAAGAVFLAVLWSVPNYPAAMPSWFNLFLATLGMAALFRHLEDDRRRWLFAAGLAGGLSFLVKVIGLYYVAGVLLFLVFHAHALSQTVATAGDDDQRGRGYATFVSVSLLLFVTVLYSVVRRQLHAPEFVQFVVPGALIAALLIRNEWTQPAGASRTRFVLLARLLVPFLFGVALPVALFLVPFARSGALGAFANGVFVVPMRRFSVVTIPALPLSTLLALVPFAMFVALAQRRPEGIRRREAIFLAAALALLLRATAGNAALYRGVWYAARAVLPVIAILGVVVLSRARGADAGSPLRRARTMLLLAVTALCSLVQLPFSAPTYFFYIAPLVVLTGLALYGYLKPTGAVAGLLVAFFAAFAVLRINGISQHKMGATYAPQYPMAPLKLERGGIDILKIHATVYDSLIPLLRAHARGGYTWASPDTPEIYFLSGLRNPTRTFFEMFDDTTNANARVLRALDAHGVTAIVLNSQPPYSQQVKPEMVARLSVQYPNWRWVGPFQLRWRE